LFNTREGKRGREQWGLKKEGVEFQKLRNGAEGDFRRKVVEERGG